MTTIVSLKFAPSALLIAYVNQQYLAPNEREELMR